MGGRSCSSWTRTEALPAVAGCPAGLLLAPTASSGATRSTTGPTIRQTGYAWWIQRVRHALGHLRPAAHRPLPRLRHLLGHPGGQRYRQTGKWENGPGMELFHALEAALGKLPIIAEDLGELLPSVRKLLADSTFPGMKVLQFAFGGGDKRVPAPQPRQEQRGLPRHPRQHHPRPTGGRTAPPAKEKAIAAAYLHLTLPCSPPPRRWPPSRLTLPAPRCCGLPWARWLTGHHPHVRLAGSGR